MKLLYIIREIFADLEAKLHEIVCRETANTKRRSGKNLVESELILRLRELESILIPTWRLILPINCLEHGALMLKVAKNSKGMNTRGRFTSLLE